MLRACTTRARDSRVGPCLPSATTTDTPSLTSQFASISPVGPAPTTSTSQSRAAISAHHFGHIAQQHRLGQADPGEFAEMQALVGTVGARIRVLDAGNQDRRTGEQLLER